MKSPTLSICIATRNRAQQLEWLLHELLEGPDPEFEVVVVDAASSDATQEICATYAARQPQFCYVRETVNSGLDRAYDMAVGIASGEYCWLFTDDDRIDRAGVQRVISALSIAPDALIVNASVHDQGFKLVLNPSRLAAPCDRVYNSADRDLVFRECGAYLSYIGAVVIRRALWLTRDRERFIGSMFIHFGVLFQQPALESIFIVSAPIVRIRYGDPSWAPHALRIWLRDWPALVWSFNSVSKEARRAVAPRSLLSWTWSLLKFRAFGSFSTKHLPAVLSFAPDAPRRWAARVAARAPASLLNFMLVCVVALLKPGARQGLYDLRNSPFATSASRRIADKILRRSP